MLEILDLTVRAGVGPQAPVLVRRASLTVAAGRVTALVGGSGSGKTTTGLAVLGLLPAPLRITGGRIRFDGEDLLALPPERMRALRGGGIAMVFQDPLQALNPLFTVGFQIDEVLRGHTSLPRARRRARVEELLRIVELPEPSRTARSYPHQLSGGMRQRVMLAQALAGEPKLVIADEPTSSLDVTVQARILDLFRRLRRELDLTILLITHDLGLVRHFADEAAVMRAGEVVETGAVAEVFDRPRHPYTRRLREAAGV